MPSASLQSKINAFETLSAPFTSPTTPRGIPKHAAKSQAINSLLETPLSPSASSLPTITPVRQPRAVSRSPSPSPPNLGRKTSLIDLKDWVVDDGPSPPRTNVYKPKSPSLANGNADFLRKPTYKVFEAKNAYSNGIAPLINLAPAPKPGSSDASKPKPPLPPRKPSITSLKSFPSTTSINSQKSNHTPPSRITVEHTYPPLKLDVDPRRTGSGHVPASSISSFHSVSLSSDTDPSTPGSVSNFIATFPMDQEHPVKSNGSEADSISLGESFEDVSTSSLASPATEAMITLDWERASSKQKLAPPKLPHRSSTTSPKLPSLKSPPPQPPRSSKPSSALRSAPNSPKTETQSLAPSFSSSNTTTRRVPPRPPHSRSSHTSVSTSTSASASDRSSVQSFTSNSTHSAHTRTISSKLSLMRQTPVPDAARKRYANLFDSLVLRKRKTEKLQAQGKPAMLSPSAAKKTRQAAGWRGLSVDLITNPVIGGNTVNSRDKEDRSEDDGEESVGPEERLDGYIVRLIWTRSRLNNGKLSSIWNECDTSNKGSLSRDAFVKGMWRIDEELRRAQLRPASSASNVGSLRQPSAFKAKSMSRPILR